MQGNNQISLKIEIKR